MKRPVVAGLAALLTVPVLAACSSSGGAVAPPSTPVPSASSVSTPPPSSSSTPAPSPSPPSSAPAALSPYEVDPAVRALRLWAAAGSRAINEGRITTPAFDAAMTPGLRKYAKDITGGEQGHYYPGPLPFTPIRVQVRSATQRDVRLCAVVGGYSLNPKTHKPWDKRRTVQAVDATAVRDHGVWLVSVFTFSSFSCHGVTIAQPTWAQS